MRLDNSDSRNLKVLQEWGERRWLTVVFDPDDPGDMPPMDVCAYCLEVYFPWEEGAVQHPDYEDREYLCALCQRILDPVDDD